MRLWTLVKDVGSAMDAIGLRSCVNRQWRYETGTYQSHAQKMIQMGFGDLAEAVQYFEQSFIQHDLMDSAFFDKMTRFIGQFAEELLSKTRPREINHTSPTLAIQRATVAAEVPPVTGQAPGQVAGTSITPPALHADGLEGGCWLWWKKKRYDVPKGVVYRLLEFMWNRDSTSYQSLESSVFEDPVLFQTIRARASDANKVLNRIGIPWRLKADAINQYLTKRPVE